MVVLPRRLVKNFDYLNSIPEDKRNRFELLCNDPCPINCPFLYNHYKEYTLYETDIKTAEKEQRIQCKTLQNNPFPARVAQKDQILPKELNSYEGLGFTEFKISGRGKKLIPPFATVPILIKEEYHEKYNTARENAIDKYCLALARLAIIKKNEGSNGMIVTGTVAKAVDDASDFAYNKRLSKRVMQHLMQSFNSYELDILQEVYDFKVFCDSRFFIDNNTECGELVHLAKFVGETRRNWLRLSIDDLKRSSKQTVKKLATLVY